MNSSSNNVVLFFYLLYLDSKDKYHIFRFYDEISSRFLKRGYAQRVKHEKYALMELLKCAECVACSDVFSGDWEEKEFRYIDVRME